MLGVTGNLPLKIMSRCARVCVHGSVICTPISIESLFSVNVIECFSKVKEIRKHLLASVQVTGENKQTICLVVMKMGLLLFGFQFTEKQINQSPRCCSVPRWRCRRWLFPGHSYGRGKAAQARV